MFFKDYPAWKQGWTFNSSPPIYVDINQNMNDEEIFHTVIHEMGHVFGLDHTDNPQFAVMAKESHGAIPIDTAAAQLLAYLAHEGIDPCAGKLTVYFSKEKHHEFE